MGRASSKMDEKDKVTMYNYTHNNTVITVFDNGRIAATAKNGSNIGLPDSSCPPFELCADGKTLTLSGDDLTLEAVSENEDGITVTYICRNSGVRVDTCLVFVPGTSVVVQTNKVTNISDKKVKLTHFSSAQVELIAHNEGLQWYKNDSIRVHICHSKWQGEAQWQSFKPYEIGLYPTSSHSSERAAFRIGTSGSWSTANFYPMTVIEDAVSGNSWFLETEGSHNWNIKFTTFGGFYAGNFTVEAISCDENNGGWFYDLDAGKSYTAERAFWGIARGGFEEAAGELIKFKRYDSTKIFADKIPVVFNVCIDGIWCKPTPEKLLPLIDRAKDAGCEYFIIDAGWSKTANADLSADPLKDVYVGDWLPKDVYKDMSLKALVKRINDSGMTAGIWLELDCVEDSAYGYTLDDNAVLKRHGNIIGGKRAFYNFENEKVRKYLADRVDELYNMGFRYIKNDYNQSTGTGADNNANGSLAEGNIANANAFYSFIDEICAKYPDLVIENCGSGGLREDNKMLRRFEAQSTSDQEIYLNNVSIVSGSSSIMPSEKAGMWAYPYPAYFKVADNFEVDEEYERSMADGCETVFNMVNAMTAVPFVSGRIDLCDSFNFSLIKAGIECYKRVREYIPKSLPVYPLGMCRLNDNRNYAYGLLSDTRLLLSAWNIDSDNTHFECDLSKYIKDGKVLNTYFAPDSIKYEWHGNKLSIDFLKKKSAIFFEIEI